MGEMKTNLQCEAPEQQAATDNVKPGERQIWETPRMDDVSEQVMAQPYIRFT
jgi:hypothetical protein